MVVSVSVNVPVDKIVEQIRSLVQYLREDDGSKKKGAFQAKAENVADAIERFEKKIAAGPDKENFLQEASAEQVLALANIMTVNVLSLARRIFVETDDPPVSLRSNTMYFETRDERAHKVCRLIMWLNSDVQSYDSATRPWVWRAGSENNEAENHAAVCVRAVLSNSITVVSDMTGYEQRDGEPIVGMISIPVQVDRAAANSYSTLQNFDLAVVNVIATRKNIIPPTLANVQRTRAKKVAALASQTNEFRHMLRITKRNIWSQRTSGGAVQQAVSGPTEDSLQRLVEAALRARDFSYAPYSNFGVGAAVLADTGEIVEGSNVENSSYGLTVCAERVAIQSAISRGLTRFQAIAIAGPSGSHIEPCGACRQVLSEFAPSGDMIVVRSRESGYFVRHTLRQLFPAAFSL